jgi:hypothetical protein
MNTVVLPEVGGIVWFDGKAYPITKVSKARITVEHEGKPSQFTWPRLALVGGDYTSWSRLGYARIVSTEEAARLQSEVDRIKAIDDATYALGRTLDKKLGANYTPHKLRPVVQKQGIEWAKALTEQLNSIEA